MSRYSAKDRPYKRRRKDMIRAFPFCAYCGIAVSDELPSNHPQKATIEHVFPLARGGLKHESNEVVACRACNLKKGAQVFGGPEPKRTKEWV